MDDASALYVGEVRHRRTRPREHALRYRVFMLLLDLDRVDGLLGRLRLLRRGRFGLMSFSAADHGDRSGRPLREQVEAKLAAAGTEAGGPIRLLTMPRILGYGFNPLSLYFCHRPDGSLAAILYEVSNTFGERHDYLIATPEGSEEAVRQSAPKRFYVSPFMDMDLSYAFTVQPPADRTGVTITVSDGEGPMLTASFAGDRRPLTDGQLLRAWLSHPLLTFKVMAGIHWEALKIWRKGVGFRHRPALPPHGVTVGQPGAAA
ncbi:DUF1365 domain-containing protein [Caulobacter segnis]|uniref:DUF1365 domain-containing protein n=1 Tax=Caulobacter segnis TaxID=88688 RepID=UPI00240F14ED|nr:DUF1365 domain-containing protein [Caulobacter segnis]MDG2523474.1 DUF1365 domain-containing protein [Caulobacter segnis]